MIDNEARERLIRFRDSVIVPLVNTDTDKWPIRAGRIGRLCLDEFSREFFEDVQSAQQQGMSIGQIAELFGNPTRLWRMSHHLLNGLRMRSVPLEVQQTSILTLLDMIANLKYGDPFCSDGANTIWSPEQVLDAEAALRPTDGPDVARLVHQLAGVLWAYTESLYFVAHEISVEVHGPYSLQNGQKLLVRDFFKLRPQPLWPSVNSFLPDYTVRIMTTYSRLNAHLDVYNNLYQEEAVRLVDEMTASAVLIDGGQANLSQIQQLIADASIAIKTISNDVDTWALEQVARHYIYIFWWRKAPLSEALQKDWRPPQAVLDRVVAGQIPDPTTSNLSLEKLRSQYDLTQ